jgi:hypothetical protein
MKMQANRNQACLGSLQLSRWVITSWPLFEDPRSWVRGQQNATLVAHIGLSDAEHIPLGVSTPYLHVYCLLLF